MAHHASTNTSTGAEKIREAVDGARTLEWAIRAHSLARCQPSRPSMASSPTYCASGSSASPRTRVTARGYYCGFDYAPAVKQTQKRHGVGRG